MRLKSFSVYRTMLCIFCHSVVPSVFFYASVCWGSRVKAADAGRLDKLIKKAGSLLGVKPETLLEVSERRMLKELLCIRSKKKILSKGAGLSATAM